MRLAKGDCVLDCPTSFLKNSFCVSSSIGRKGRSLQGEGWSFGRWGKSERSDCSVSVCV